MLCMKRFLAVILSAAAAALPMPLTADAEAASLMTKRFDFGGLGATEGYTGVSAADGYDAKKGCGFENPAAVEDVPAGGAGALADAVRFKSDVPNHIFSVDLPRGVYRITVTTGDVQSTTITAERWPQLFFLTGSNASDSFTIPVTDGQLNLYAGSGVGTAFSISTLEIEQTSAGTETKPTIWVCGDSTAAGKDPTVRFDNQNKLPTGRLKLVQTAPLTGDVNADGNFDLADAVLLQKWLLAVSDTQPADWRAGDFSGNGRLDAKDFALMKRALLA